MRPSRIVAVVVIFVFASLAWFILGGTLVQRTQAGYQNIGPEVRNLWGQPLEQTAPTARIINYHPKTHAVVSHTDVDLSSSHIEAAMQLEYRRRGLLWFSGYLINFDGRYTVQHNADGPRDVIITYTFPSAEASYDSFIFVVNGKENWMRGEGTANLTIRLAPGQTIPINVSYQTRGMDQWSYTFGTGVQRIRDFSLRLKTNFSDYDFPLSTISPAKKSRTADGWDLLWESKSMLSGFKIGIIVPEKLNPGDIASRIAFFAPIGLFFFFTVVLIWCLMQRKLHPMHFLFLAAGFFAFHLLFAYLVDHLNVFNTFVVSSAVSLLLVVNYMRLVVGMRYALAPTAIAQIVYLVLFSYAFFFKGFTGLTITIGAILTLAVLMQVTGKVDWEQSFMAKESAKRVPEGLAKVSGGEVQPKEIGPK